MLLNITIIYIFFVNLWFHIQRNAQGEVIICNILNSSYLCKISIINIAVIRGSNSSDVPFFQIALRIFALNLIYRIDEHHLSTTFRALIHPTNHDTSFHRRVVEKIRSETDNTFYFIAAHQSFTHCTFLITEKNSVREQDSASASIVLQTCDNVLKECIISTTLRRHTQEVTTIFITFKCCAIPLTN